LCWIIEARNDFQFRAISTRQDSNLGLLSWKPSVLPGQNIRVNFRLFSKNQRKNQIFGKIREKNRFFCKTREKFRFFCKTREKFRFYCKTREKFRFFFKIR